jgi:hypothetical protein
MEKYKSLNHNSRIPELQHIKGRYRQKATEDMHDVPEMIYSPMMDFERTFLCQMCNKILLFKLFIRT